MVNKKTVLKWSYPDLGFEVNDDNEVTLIIANPVVNFTEVQVAFLPAREVLKTVWFVCGRDTVVKKVNFQKHVSESVMHQTAALHLKEKLVIQPSVMGDDEPTTSTAASASSSYHGTQTTLLPYVQK